MTIKALYPTIEPSLELDFANTKALDPRITFTRASTGTCVGVDGVIKTAGNGVARFDHDPVTGASLGLLVEEARTNIGTYSEQFDNAAWTKNNSTITANATTAPDGTLTADRLLETATTATFYVANFGSATATPGTYTASVFAKGDGSGRLLNMTLQQSGFYQQSYFNLATGVVSNVDGTLTASIQALANGWFRCSVTGTSSTTTTLFIYTAAAAGENSVYSVRTGSASAGIFIWGAQVEAGSFPTSYIPTTTATVTRAADVASMTGANFSSWWNVNQFTLFADARIRYYPTGYGYSGYVFGFGASAPRVNFGTNEASNRPIAVQFYDGTTNHINRTGAYEDLTINSSLKMALSFNGTSSSVTYNNRAISQVTSAAVNLSGIASLNIGQPADTPAKLNGTIARLAFYPVRLPDAQLQALTAT